MPASDDAASASAAVTASAPLYRAVMRQLPDAAVLVYDRQLRFVLAEGEALTRIGWDRDELVGRTLYEVVPPTAVAKLEPHYRRALEGETSSFATQSVRGQHEFEIDAVPLTGDSGEVVGGMVVARDVTEARRASDALRDAERRLRYAFDDAPTGMALVSLAGECLRSNRALSAMTGYSADDLLGMDFEQLRHPEDAALDEEQLRRLLAGEMDRYEVERRYRTASATYFWALLSVSLVRDGEGRPLFYAADVIDITARRQLREELADLAMRDPLTGLFNRRHFAEVLAIEAGRGEAGGRAALLLLDLDHFKAVNDSFGHMVGDRLVARLAEEMRRQCRAVDLAARIGGDEFAFILPDADREEAEQVARRMLETVAEHGVIRQGDRRVAATASIGIALIDGDTSAPEVVQEAADRALFAAKHGGRGRYVVASSNGDHEQPTPRLADVRVLEVTGTGSWSMDLDTKTTRWSAGMFAILGLEPDDRPRSVEDVLSVVHRDDRERISALLGSVDAGDELDDDEQEPREFRIVRADGAVREIRARGHIESDAEGRATRWLGSFQDITEQRLSERELRAHYALSQALHDWEHFDESAPQLLRRLGEALEYPMAALWARDGDRQLLTCRTFWSAEGIEPGEFEVVTRRLTFPRGSGLGGRVWETGKPILVPDVRSEPDFRRPDTAAALGVASAMLFPAIGPGGPVAVLAFYSFEPRPPSERLIRTLEGVGRELGRFLGRRSAQLGPLPLSPREVEVLGMAAEGHSGPDIAAGLVLSPATVKTHFQNIYEKLGVSERSAAVALALRTGLID